LYFPKYKVLPPFINIICFSFVKLMYLGYFLVYKFE
jgi:hypothetical protein